MIATLIAWAKSLMQKPLPSPSPSPNHLSNRDKLRIWIEIHMPELDRELGPLRRLAVLAKLNEVTGCDVASSDSVERSCAVFLEALKKMKGASTAPKPADRSEITRWVEQNMPQHHKNEDKS